MGPVESLGRVRAKGLALLAVAFVAGALCGAAVMRLRTPAPDGLIMARVEPGGLPPMYAELGLSPEQRTRIQRIVEGARPTTDSLVQATLPRLRALTDSVDRAMRAVLTPEQRRELDRRFPPGEVEMRVDPAPFPAPPGGGIIMEPGGGTVQGPAQAPPGLEGPPAAEVPSGP